MIKRKNLALIVSLLACTSAAVAGEQAGTVLSIIKRNSDGLLYFYMSGTHTARPACAAAQSYWMIKDENSNAGKQQLSMLLLARATGQLITVTGSNTCTRWGDGEDVDLIVM